MRHRDRAALVLIFCVLSNPLWAAGKYKVRIAGNWGDTGIFRIWPRAQDIEAEILLSSWPDRLIDQFPKKVCRQFIWRKESSGYVRRLVPFSIAKGGQREEKFGGNLWFFNHDVFGCGVGFQNNRYVRVVKGHIPIWHSRPPSTGRCEPINSLGATNVFDNKRDCRPLTDGNRPRKLEVIYDDPCSHGLDSEPVGFAGDFHRPMRFKRLVGRNSSVDYDPKKSQSFYDKTELISGLFLFFGGGALVCYFYRNLYFNLTPNVNIAGHVALLLACACVIWVGMGLCAHGCEFL